VPAAGVRLPVFLLAAVACIQIGLARTADLSPWVGGGFGMFSTADSWGRRHLHAHALRPGVRRELILPPEAERDLLRALALPSDRHLSALARWLEALPSPDEGPPRAIEFQVWSVRFEPEDLAPRGVLLRSVEVPIAE